MALRNRKERLHATYATTFDPGDVRAWSGTIYHLAQALEGAGAELDYCGELARNRVLVNKAINRITKLSAIGEVFPVERTRRMATLFADQLREHLMSSRSDVVFSPGSIPLALLKTKRPKVFYTDATFAGILAQYPEFRAYPKRYIQEGHDLERRALENCEMAIYSSQWAVDTAVEHYGADPARMRIVPFGSNMREEPTAEAVRRFIAARDGATLELLFIGVAWERKGGPKVLELTRLLHEEGIPVRLHIVGSGPGDDELPPYCVQHGFISKETTEGREAIAGLFAKAHFLLLPSQAECLGIVLCEANAFGVPCLANEVGGIPEVVRNGVNGQLFALDAPAEEWAAHIVKLFNDRSGYTRLAQGSRAQFEERLNWGSAGRAIADAMIRLL